MHLLQVGNNAVRSLGGIPQAIADVRRALGGEVVSLTEPERIVADDGVLHLPQAAGPARRYGWPAAGATAAAQPLFERCDVVMIHGLYRHHVGWAARLARAHGKPYLIWPHGALDPHVFSYRGLPKRAWWRLAGSPAARRAAGMIFATERERERAAPVLPPVQRHVVHLPVAVPDLADRAELRASLRRRLGIDPADRVLLFLGRLDPIKRVPAIVEAFNRAGHAALHLIVAGPDSSELRAADCARLVAPALRSRVHFTGAVHGAEWRAVFSASDAFIAVSAHENFAYALAEALAWQLPALVGPGLDLGPELVDARCSWQPGADDAGTLAAAFRAIATSPDDALQDMGGRGRQWVREHLSPEGFRAALERVCAAGTA